MVAGLVLIYLAVMIGLGVATARRARQGDRFFVAGRAGSAGLVASSLLATSVGASATTGLAGRAFEVGLPAAWWLLVGTVGLLVLGWGLAARVQAAGVYTLPGLLAAQYGGGRWLRPVASALIVIAWLGVIAAQLVGSAAVLRQVLGAGGAGWLWGIAAVLVAYTALGGQLAVLRTDAWQLAVMLAGLAVALVCGLRQVGGMAGLGAALPADLLRFPVNEAMPARQVLDWLLAVGLLYVVGPDMVSRLLCARDGATARRAATLAAAALVPIAFGVAGLGLLARVVAPEAPPAGALLVALEATLPPWALGWLAAALLAAMMSSGSTCLLTAATILVVDVAGGDPDAPRTVARTRTAIVAIGLAATLVATRRHDIIGSLMFAYSIYAGGIVVPVLFGFWRERLGLTAGGALVAVLLGGGVALQGALTHHDRASLAIGVATVTLLLGRRWGRGGRIP